MVRELVNLIILICGIFVILALAALTLMFSAAAVSTVGWWSVIALLPLSFYIIAFNTPKARERRQAASEKVRLKSLVSEAARNVSIPKAKATRSEHRVARASKNSRRCAAKNRETIYLSVKVNFAEGVSD